MSAKPKDLNKYWQAFAQKVGPVFPLEGKKPRFKGWQEKASRDPEVISGWLEEYGEDCSFGLATGSASGILGLDIDTKNGKRGLEFLETQLADLPDTVKVSTVNGGLHFWYRIPKGLTFGNRTDIFGPNSGVDIKADGGYLVVPFSSGYAFEGKLKPPGGVAEIPEFLARLLTRKKEEKKQGDYEDVSIEDVRKLLDELDPTAPEFETRDGWEEIMRSVHSATDGSDEGMELFTEWSLRHPGPWEKDVESEIQRDWYSYSPDGSTTIGTLIHHVSEKRKLDNTPKVEDALTLESDADTPMFSRRKGKIIPTPHNAFEFLRAPHIEMAKGDGTVVKAPNECGDLLSFNELTREIQFIRKAPRFFMAKKGDGLEDHHITRFREFIGHMYRVDFGKDCMRDATVSYGRSRSFHPVREYLESLQWDGKERLSTWIPRYMGTPEDVYHIAISRASLVSAVARVMAPGSKVDTMLVFEGPQGCRKSTVVELMGRRQWYSCPKLNIAGLGRGDTSAVTDTLASWVIEVPEMMGISNAEELQVKAFLSTSHDKVTLKYDKFATTVPRQFILVGTMNPYGEGRYIKDHTGARRYWPVSVMKSEINPIDTDALDVELDQLYAEAVVAFKNGEKWYLEGDALLAARSEQAKRIVGNDLKIDVDVFFTLGAGKDLKEFHLRDVIRKIWPHEKRIRQYNRDTLMEYGKSLGWEYSERLKINDKFAQGFKVCT